MLHHAMREVFPKLENEPAVGLLGRIPTTVATHSLIPKPLGEAGHIGHGGYLLKDVLQ